MPERDDRILGNRTLWEIHEFSFGEKDIASHYTDSDSEGLAWPLIFPYECYEDWLAKKVKLGTNLGINHALDQY